MEQGTCKLSQTSVGLSNVVMWSRVLANSPRRLLVSALKRGSEGIFRRGDWRECSEEGVRGFFLKRGVGENFRRGDRREVSEEGVGGKLLKWGVGEKFPTLPASPEVGVTRL